MGRISNFVNIAVLAAILHSGCATDKSLHYKLPQAAKYHMDFEDKDDLYTKRQLLKISLDNLVVSKLLNDKLIPKLETMDYYLQYEIDPTFGGTLSGNKVTIYPQREEGIYVLGRNGRLVEKTMETGIHELAHWFFDNELTSEQQSEYNRRIRKRVEDFNTLPEVLANLSEDELTEVLGKKGFDISTYIRFKRFLDNTDFYIDYYGAHFDEKFFGTEAFASLIADELYDKFTYVYLYTYQGYDKLDGELREAVLENLSELKGIPPEILAFYKGFVNERYTDAPE